MTSRKTYDRAAILSALCDWVAEGKTVRDFCRQEGMPSAMSVYNWMEEDEAAALRFARARQSGFDRIADHAMTIADGKEDAKGQEPDERKLRVWTRLQLLARWDPKRYGERQALEHSGGVSVQVTTGVPLPEPVSAPPDEKARPVAERPPQSAD